MLVNTNDFTNALGVVLRAIRSTKAANQADLARIIGTSQSRVSRLEASLNTSSIENMHHYCTALGYKMSDVMGMAEEVEALIGSHPMGTAPEKVQLAGKIIETFKARGLGATPQTVFTSLEKICPTQAGRSTRNL
jgi:transcriptional regulator with XRE-family HTH domain